MKDEISEQSKNILRNKIKENKKEEKLFVKQNKNHND